MEVNTLNPSKAALLMPTEQLQIVKENSLEFYEVINRLETVLEKCPGIGETDEMEEHPAVFHYFCGRSDIFICEFDRKDLMFGYAILGGDLVNSEWGYFSLEELRKIPLLNIDFHFSETSIEAALYKEYPSYFSKPPSLSGEKK